MAVTAALSRFCDRRSVKVLYGYRLEGKSFLELPNEDSKDLSAQADEKEPSLGAS